MRARCSAPGHDVGGGRAAAANARRRQTMKSDDESGMSAASSAGSADSDTKHRGSGDRRAVPARPPHIDLTRGDSGRGAGSPAVYGACRAQLDLRCGSPDHRGHAQSPGRLPTIWTGMCRPCRRFQPVSRRLVTLQGSRPTISRAASRADWVGAGNVRRQRVLNDEVTGDPSVTPYLVQTTDEGGIQSASWGRSAMS